MSFIETLQVNNFRCYDGGVLGGLGAGPVVLCGSNGAGKTNILEAVSFLTPGRGLRSARIVEVQKNNSPAGQPWAISARVNTVYGPMRIGTGRDGDADRRVIRINGENAKGGQAALNEYLSVLWLTPQMDRLFMDGAAGRRKFLDRMVFAFDPGHSGRMTRYENAMRQRSKLLQDGVMAGRPPDPAWLDALEITMAETGVSIAAARQDFVVRLQQAIHRASPDIADLFPRAELHLSGTVEELVSRVPAIEAEDMIRYQLRESRARDAQYGGATTGPHKSDLWVTYAAKAMPADQCSTGEQKALLVGIVLAHARMVAAERGAPPILLLDEIAAHLDERRRVALYGQLSALRAQVWMTGTDLALFDFVRADAMMIAVEGGVFTPLSTTAVA